MSRGCEVTFPCSAAARMAALPQGRERGRAAGALFLHGFSQLFEFQQTQAFPAGYFPRGSRERRRCRDAPGFARLGQRRCRAVRVNIDFVLRQLPGLRGCSLPAPQQPRALSYRREMLLATPSTPSIPEQTQPQGMQDAGSPGMLQSSRSPPSGRKFGMGTGGRALPGPWHIPELGFFLIVAVFSPHSHILLPGWQTRCVCTESSRNQVRAFPATLMPTREGNLGFPSHVPSRHMVLPGTARARRDNASLTCHSHRSWLWDSQDGSGVAPRAHSSS